MFTAKNGKSFLPPPLFKNPLSRRERGREMSIPIRRGGRSSMRVSVVVHGGVGAGSGGEISLILRGGLEMRERGEEGGVVGKWRRRERVCFWRHLSSSNGILLLLLLLPPSSPCDAARCHLGLTGSTYCYATVESGFCFSTAMLLMVVSP